MAGQGAWVLRENAAYEYIFGFNLTAVLLISMRLNLQNSQRSPGDGTLDRSLHLVCEQQFGADCRSRRASEGTRNGFRQVSTTASPPHYWIAAGIRYLFSKPDSNSELDHPFRFLIGESRA